MARIRILYFAKVRDSLGIDEESIQLPDSINNTRDLQLYLSERGGDWKEQLSESNSIRVAVNQDIVQGSKPLKDGDEVAFFPPVTGG